MQELSCSGNNNLNLLTSSKRYKLRIDLADFNGTTKYAEYDNFVVKASTDNYTLSALGTYTGTAGN
jgi:ficolin